MTVARRRIIVGVGEALLEVGPDHEEPAGLGLRVPMHAVQLGDEGVVVSRIGQDAVGDSLLAMLRARGVDVSHLQTDPDLASGRLLVGRPGPRRLDAIAFDNLQWDFDLVDVAQRADAVVHDMMIRRSGQSRSVVDRFLTECSAALCVFDLTGCADSHPVRGDAMSGLDHAQVAVVDDAALDLVLPGGRGADDGESARQVMDRHDLSAVVVAEPGRPLTVGRDDETRACASPHRRELHHACVVGLVHGMLAGWTLEATVRLAEQFSRHCAEHPDEPAPDQMIGKPA